MARSISSGMFRSLLFFALFICATAGISAAQADTTSTILGATTASTLGQAASLTATVADGDVPASVPTGTVSFFDNGALIGSTMVDGVGLATFTTSVLAVGSHTITAAYHSDTPATFADSATVASATQTVNARSTGVSIVLNTPTITVRGSSSVTFTVTDNPPANASAGTFTAAVNALHFARSGHAAALLPNGKVFIVGGQD